MKPTKLSFFSICLAIFTAYSTIIISFIWITTFTDHHDSTLYSNNTPSQWKSMYNQDAKALKYPGQEKPKWQNVAFENVTIEHDDVRLSGWLTMQDATKPIIIIVHGITPNSKAKDEAILLYSLLAKAKFNVLSIDLQNYGQSTITSNFIKLGQTEYLDVVASVQWLIEKKGFHPSQIGVAGLSLGAVTSAVAFSKDPHISALWLDSPFTNFNTMVAHELSRYQLHYHDIIKQSIDMYSQWLFGFQLAKHSTMDAISHANGRPILITHGKKDNRIPISHAIEFINTAQKKKANVSYWLVANEGHLEALLNQPEHYQKNLITFFSQHLTNKPSS